MLKLDHLPTKSCLKENIKIVEQQKNTHNRGNQGWDDMTAMAAMIHLERTAVRSSVTVEALPYQMQEET